MTQLELILGLLQKNVDHWVHCDDLAAISGSRAVHSAIDKIRGLGHVVRCCVLAPGEGSYYRLVSPEVYRRWAAGGFKRVEGETKQHHD